MDWVEIIWSMFAATCLTLAVVQGFVWWRRRQVRAHGLFALAAVGTALLAGTELWMMHAETPVEISHRVRWFYAAAWLASISLVGFMRQYLKAGRRWLAWTVYGARTLVLIINFALPLNLGYRTITGVRKIPFLGQSVSVAVGVPSPWLLLGQFSLLLLVLFAVDATLSVWRRGNHKRAVVVGGSVVFFTLLGSSQSVLTFWHVLPMPSTPSVFFLAIVIAMSYELSYDSARAAQMGQDLQESEHRLELAADAAQLGVWVRDLETDKIWASDKWRSLFGFSESEPLNFSLMMERIHPNDHDDLTYAINRAIDEASSYEREYRVVVPSRQMRWISSHGKVELNDRGKPERVIGLSMDVTQRKMAELEAVQQRQELTHLSRVTMLGELSGSMAHELNQPLTAILSNAQAAQNFLAQGDTDLNEVKEILADIVDQDHRAGEVIRRLRLLLKEGEVQQLPLDLNEVLMDGLKLIRNDLVNKGVTLVPRFAPSLPSVIGDRVQLQQVLVNLVMNACDAMTDNAPTDRRLVVSTELSNGQGVLCSVSDVGPGIPAERLTQVFNPFFTTKSHGLGLGLSVCRSIIEAHGGRLWASNNPERGTTFHFTIRHS